MKENFFNIKDNQLEKISGGISPRMAGVISVLPVGSIFLVDDGFRKTIDKDPAEAALAASCTSSAIVAGGGCLSLIALCLGIKVGFDSGKLTAKQEITQNAVLKNLKPSDIKA